MPGRANKPGWLRHDELANCDELIAAFYAQHCDDDDDDDENEAGTERKGISEKYWTKSK